MTAASKEYIVGSVANGQRLDSWLAETAGVTRSQVTKRLRSAEVLLNGTWAKASSVIAEGDRIVVPILEPIKTQSRQSGGESQPVVTDATMSASEVTPPHEPVPEVDIVYEDNEVVIINKPAGLLVHTGNGYGGEPTVAAYARIISTDTDSERPGIVHRLDRDTSGLLIIAKSAASKAALQALWKKRLVTKRYELLVDGRPKQAEAIIDLPLDRDPAIPTRRAVVIGGRPAKTRYRLTQAYPGYSLLDAWPETGRTHQLRVHLAAIGHPIVGDSTYGMADNRFNLNRQFLHAAQLKLQLPSGRNLDISAPLPVDLKTVLDRLSSSL